MDSYQALASYRNCVERMAEAWPGFLEARAERLRQQTRHGVAAEKVAEGIIEDLFTSVLDWLKGDLDYQVGYADVLVTKNYVKYLLVEVKRPGALAWHRAGIQAALDQACRYAGEQKVKCVAVSDGTLLYAANVVDGGLRDRLFVDLTVLEPPASLWWLSVHGIYRVREGNEDLCPPEAHASCMSIASSEAQAPGLLHSKYKLPARCFGYVGNPADPATWKLPYLTSEGGVDEKRLPKAIQAVISNYRGVKVSGIPEPAIPDVLVRLAQAAARSKKLPCQNPSTALAYVQLWEILDQLGRTQDVLPSEKR